MSVYVGMDVHRKRTQVAILTEDGEEVLNRNVDNDHADLTSLLGDLPEGTPAVFEAGYGWSWVVELLEELGLEPHMAHPGGCRAIASARLKNDRVDARTLAHLLRTDLLAEAWMAPPVTRDLRAMLRHRATLVRTGTRLKCRVHAILADRGLHPPMELWTKAGRVWLEEQDLSPTYRAIVDDSLAMIDALAPLIRRLDREVRAAGKDDPRVQALMELPGVGEVVALMLVAEIGDISRFPTSRKLCSWAGLTPAVRNSDRKVRHGHITKQGSVWVRWALGEAAQVAKNRPPLAASYARILQRRGKQIATVAIARKLLARAFHVLKQVSQEPKVSAPGALEV